MFNPGPAYGGPYIQTRSAQMQYRTQHAYEK